MGLLALFSCAGALGEPEPPLEEVALQDASGAPVIATLKTRHGLVTLTSGAGQVLYAVLDEQGESGALSLQELASRHPQLFELLERAMASRQGPIHADRAAPVLDARLDLPVKE